eukprot:CAMPEP_0168760776 /NCGR_PEP_ID=MMETSP0724-20121128/22949_1 /TAXON_ID=265536 /ORGANISM="Amphiprora sp., Strain CCMP467" /LENGTH=237 /DNA_ID=CAMNT_0008809813 /DNA_START=9 /DNA_END=722 /DNA_ORIENTATION=-
MPQAQVENPRAETAEERKERRRVQRYKRAMAQNQYCGKKSPPRHLGAKAHSTKHVAHQPVQKRAPGFVKTTIPYDSEEDGDDDDDEPVVRQQILRVARGGDGAYIHPNNNYGDPSAETEFLDDEEPPLDTEGFNNLSFPFVRFKGQNDGEERFQKRYPNTPRLMKRDMHGEDEASECVAYAKPPVQHVAVAKKDAVFFVLIIAQAVCSNFESYSYRVNVGVIAFVVAAIIVLFRPMR